jgi:hypothetical protein
MISTCLRCASTKEANNKEKIFGLENRRKSTRLFFLLQPRAADCHMTHADLYSALFALISSQGKNKKNVVN